MISTDYAAVKIRAEEHDRHLTAYDFHWHHYTYVLHDDGSRFLFNNSILEEDGDYWIVYSEHNGFHVYAKDEALVIVLE
jgi:hypothetical protein